MALDATVGSATANSYLTQSEATAYFATRLYVDDWTNASSGNKDAALITATKRIDQEFFEGQKVSSTQALRWPRYAAQIPGEQYSYGSVFYSYFAYDTIPQPVKDAVCELALHLLAGDTLKQTGLENFRRLTVGPISLETYQPVRAGILPDQVYRLLNGLLANSGGEIVRG